MNRIYKNPPHPCAKKQHFIYRPRPAPPPARSAAATRAATAKTAASATAAPGSAAKAPAKTAKTAAAWTGRTRRARGMGVLAGTRTAPERSPPARGTGMHRRMIAAIAPVAETAANAGKQQKGNKQQQAKTAAAATYTVKSKQIDTTSLRLRRMPLFVFLCARFSFQKGFKARVALREGYVGIANLCNTLKQGIKQLSHARIIVAGGKISLQVFLRHLVHDAGAEFNIQTSTRHPAIVLVFNCQNHKKAILLFGNRRCPSR